MCDGVLQLPGTGVGCGGDGEGEIGVVCGVRKRFATHRAS